MDQQTSPISIFRAGDFVSNEGTAVSFTEADLVAMADAYDAAADPAPLVIGHPKLDDPAYGWVASLSFADGELKAVPERVEPQFAQLVRDGRFSKVSARFYPPAHPANPKPGNFYLKHVGFLGAAAPAVKGLGTVAFADAADADTITFDLNQEKLMSELSFAERSAALDARAQELDAREATIVANQEQLAADRIKALHAVNLSFAEGLVKATTLAPAGKELVVGILDHLDATALVSFGEAGEMTPADAMRQLLSSGAPLIDIGERGKAVDEGDGLASFAAPAGYEVDAARAELFSRSKQIQNANPDLDWMTCVKRAEAG